MHCIAFFLVALWAVLPVTLNAATYTLFGTGRSNLIVEREGTEAFTLACRTYGPGWKQPNMSLLTGTPEVREGKVRGYKDRFIFTATAQSKAPVGAQLDFDYTLKQSGARSFELQLVITPDKDFQFAPPKGANDPVGALAIVIDPSKFLEGGTLLVTTPEGESKPVTLPPAQGSANGVTKATITTPSGMTAQVTFAPGVHLHRDHGELRFMTQSAQPTPAGKAYVQTITFELDSELNVELENRWVDTSKWFRVNVDNDFTKPSEIGMADWFEKPAGKRGFLKMKGDRIVHGDGTPFTLWGTNILRANNALINAQYMKDAPEAAAFYGNNVNRLHAFAKPHDKKWAHMFKLMDTEDSFKFHPEHLDLFDLIFAESKKRGIYTGWSVFYGWFPTPADKQHFIAWDEAQTMIRKQFPREGSWYNATAVMPDVQDLMIKWHVQLLNHTNKYTGIRYADDAALAWVELQNEENVYLGIRSYEEMLKNAPTYRKLYFERFATFLKEKYKTQDGLAQAWGNALAKGDSLDAANITPFPAWYNPAQGKPTQRIADQYHFIYLTQLEYYKKFEKAVRDTGYGGLLVGSCWQAADWLGHLYNTYLDAQVGMIDRHNYGRDHLNKPGTGLLSAGFQQVMDRVFNFSEWGGDAKVGQSIDSPIIAFYGMGLQGWAGSQQFAWDHNGVLSHPSTNINNSCNPFANLVQYVTLSRSVHRGDVKMGDLAGLRRVSVPRLKQSGDVGFFEEFSLLGNANNKSFKAAIPQESLAVGRVQMEFVEGEVTDPIVDKTKGFIDRDKRVVRSNTGELEWDYSGGGFIRVDTDGTAAVIGNVGGQSHALKHVTFNSRSPYAHLYLTALEKDKNLATGKRLLVTAIGRTVGEGTKFDELANEPMVRPAKNTDPAIVEPIQATISLQRSGKATVTPLDHNGRKVPELQPLAVRQEGDRLVFDIDGTVTKTVYYLVEFP